MSYKNSLFNIAPVVEVAYDLHLVAALLRSSCSTLSEGKLRANAIGFEGLRNETYDSPAAWADGVSVSGMLKDRALIAPKSKNQSLERHVPISRQQALVVDFVRKDTNLWDVGRRVSLMVRRGCADKQQYESLMLKLGDGPADIWQSYVDLKISSLIKSAGGPYPANLTPVDKVRDADVAGEDLNLSRLLYPYSQALVRSLEVIMRWKRVLPARHFSCLLDALLRLHAFTELHHLANANIRLFEVLLQAKDGATFQPQDISNQLSPKSIGPVVTGTNLIMAAERLSWKLERSRVFMNMLDDRESRLGSIGDLASWCADIRGGSCESFNNALESFHAIDRTGELDKQIDDSFPRNNFEEFFRYIISQRVTTTGADGQFDQGYWARKGGTHKSAKWLVQVSPVGGLLFAGLASGDFASCSFREMRERFEDAGLRLTPEARDELFNALKDLGVAVDNPDSDGGFLVRNPFHIWSHR